MLGRLASTAAARLFVGAVYPTGLTLLIPLVLVRLAPASLDVAPAGSARALAWAAGVMVAASLLVSLSYTRSLAGSLKSLGRLTFAPGLLGLVFSVSGREAVLAYLGRTLPRFAEVEGLVALYLDRAVPSVRYLTVGFFVVGALLLFAGRQLDRSGSRATAPS